MITYVIKNRLLLIIFLHSFCFQSYSQNIEKIKKADTVYIYFKKGKGQVHIKEKTPSPEIKYDTYIFSFDNIKKGYLNEMTILHRSRLNHIERKEKKPFLIKNKDLIVTYDFLTKHNLSEMTELLNNKKKVYLINYDDIGWFTIKLKEVKVIGVFKPSIE
jgi:hypothetical protein